MSTDANQSHKMFYNYDTLKQLAKELRRPVPSLIALARQNDPFYVGTEQDKKDGQWFHEIWQQFGFSWGVHIRRVHYAVVSANPQILMPNGKPYINTEACWKYLTDAAKAARYLELVDPAAFVDRRNEVAVDYVDYETKRGSYAFASSAEEMGSVKIDFPDIPEYYLTQFDTPQRYHLEVWCEKSTMNDILRPLCRRYQAVLMYGKGELSITMSLDAIKRFQKSGKPVRIFYVSDFDPAGVGMPVSMSRKLEYFIRKLELDIDVKLFPVVLTAEQVNYYKHQPVPILPTPIKESERRKDKFEKRYGNGNGENVAVELDALEALYPGELRRILETEMDRYYDKTLASRVETAKSELESQLEDIQDEVYAGYEDELKALRAEEEEMQRIFDEQLSERIASHSLRRYQLSKAIEHELDRAMPVIEDDVIPQAAIANERENALFDSKRDYLEQNEVYQRYKGNIEDADDIA